ncbi:unnamed protein product [Alopecurus aequalis]
MAAASATMQVEQDLPGFRFHPTEEELLGFYLSRVALGKKLHIDIIGTLNIYRHEPWDLPGMAKIGERVWAIRSTGDTNRVIGLKKTLVFYQGQAPRGTKTDWVMNEYRLPDHAPGAAPPREDTVICKIYRKATPLRELEQRACAMEEMMSQRPGACNGGGSIRQQQEQGWQDAPRDAKKEADIATVTVAPASSRPKAMNPPCIFQLPPANAPCNFQLPAASNGASNLPSLQLPAARPPCPVQVPAASHGSNLPSLLLPVASHGPLNLPGQQLPAARPPSPCSSKLPAASNGASNLSSLQLPAASQLLAAMPPSPCSVQLRAVSQGASNLPSLQLPAAGHGVLEWLQDPFLTQLRSPWQDQQLLSPYGHLLYY